MSQQVGVLDLSFTAGEDLSSNQYYFVYLSDDHTVKLCTTNHVDAIGVLQNEPESGEMATVRVLGTTKAIVAESISVGNRIYVDTDGKANEEDAADDTEARLVGIALEASSEADDIIEILLMHFSFVKGTS